MIVSEEMAARLGDRPVTATMTAYVIKARRRAGDL
jgi:hypothetical protein